MDQQSAPNIGCRNIECHLWPTKEKWHTFQLNAPLKIWFSGSTFCNAHIISCNTYNSLTFIKHLHKNKCQKHDKSLVCNGFVYRASRERIDCVMRFLPHLLQSLGRFQPQAPLPWCPAIAQAHSSCLDIISTMRTQKSVLSSTGNEGNQQNWTSHHPPKSILLWGLKAVQRSLRHCLILREETSKENIEQNGTSVAWAHTWWQNCPHFWREMELEMHASQKATKTCPLLLAPTKVPVYSDQHITLQDPELASCIKEAVQQH